MQERNINDKRTVLGNLSLLTAIVLQTTLLWNEYTWYEAVAPYTTLISLLFLAVTFLCYVSPKSAISDPYFWATAVGIAVAGINLVIIDSGKGAFLTAADVLLVAYLADKIRFSAPFVWFSFVYVGAFFYYWTFDVKGYFKGYNTNYGGLVLITGFVFAVTGLIAFYKKLKESTAAGARFTLFVIVFMFAWGYNIIAWYRARCALLGLVVFALLLIIPSKVWKSKVFYTFVILCATVGAIAISILYVLLGPLMRQTGIRVFYKDIISGRDEIWADLWGAFLRSPITGIGSSYKINVDWMGGMFEVHNGLLDILIVHGIVVFAIVCFMLIQRLMKLRENVQANIVARSAFAAVSSILAASFMENFFIVPPFLLCTLVLIAIAGSV